MTSFLNSLCCKNVYNALKKFGKPTTTSQFFRFTKRGVYRQYSITSKLQQVYLIDEEPNSNSNPVNNINNYTYRSCTCGELRSKHVGECVVLCGWLEFNRMNKFILLRDSYGVIQLLIDEKDIETQKLLDTIPFESIIQVKGTVLSRPKKMINVKQSTGEVEVLVDNFKVLNKSKPNLPFNIREFQKAKESLRMQYRYLDLRFPQMQRNLRVRSKFIMKIREFLINNNFIDVETPTLFKATPGGAQEFIVPTRFAGEFFSLVQSPQQFKQMLMAGAIDRYFQIARCYRDESTRSDRQPEFTQLDIELSFTSLESVIKLVEDLITYAWPDYLDPISSKFERMTYDHAMKYYGCDKPDLTFGFKINNCTSLLKTNKSVVQYGNFGAYFLLFPKEYANLGKDIKESISNLAKKYPNAKLVQSKVTTIKDWINKLSKLLTNEIAEAFANDYKVPDDSVLFLAYGEEAAVLSLLGQVRLEYANFLEKLGITIRQKRMHFLWVVDFPLFEISEESGLLKSAHHPFTAPHPDDIHLLKSDSLKVRALSYDLTLNGSEVAGGSIRIHDPSLQKTILDMLDIKADSMQHMLDMLGSGCPPHGGVALGLDRLLSILLNTSSIRDVIAFPKNFEGRDPLSGAPSVISDKEKELYHIKSITNKK